MPRPTSIAPLRALLCVLLAVLGGTALTAPAVATPVNQVRPSLSGVVAVGATVTCVPGTWTAREPRTTDYRWRIDPRGANTIVGTGTTYEPTPADEGLPLQCDEIVTDPDGAVLRASVEQVVAPAQPLQNAVPPRIVAANVRQGDRATCDPGTWSRTATYAYAWLRNGAPIADATSASYEFVEDDVARDVACRVTATATVGGQSATATSAALLIQGPPPPPPTPAPAPTGPPLAIKAPSLSTQPLFEQPPLARAIAAAATGGLEVGGLSWRTSPQQSATSGDVRITGIELTQATQYRLGAYGEAGLPNRCQDAPIPWEAPVCAPGKPVKYAGVNLAAGRALTARVFLDRAGTPRASSVQARLTVRSASGAVLGSMVQTVSSVRTAVAAGVPAIVSDAQRRDPTRSVNFTVPAGYVRSGTMSLEAEVVPLDEGCPSGDCTLNNRYVLTSVPVVETGTLRLGTVRIGLSPLPPAAERATSTADTLRTTGLATARTLLPVRDIEVPPSTQELVVDTSTCDAMLRDPAIGAALRANPSFLMSCRGLLAYSATEDLATQSPGWTGGVRRYDSLVGLVQSQGGYTRGWGSTGLNITNGPTTTTRGPFAVFESQRVTKTVAHELGHNTGLPHAGPACDSGGEAWPDDERGRMQGVGWRDGRVLDDASGEFYDLMSYCGDESQAWVSPRNWDRMVEAFRQLDVRAAGSGVRQARRAADSAGTTVTALLTAGTATITSLTPGGAAPSGAPSGYVVRAVNAAGGVLTQAPAVRLDPSEAIGGDLTLIAGRLPGSLAGAARVEVVPEAGGAAIGNQARPSGSPTVRLLPLRAGPRGARTVRWSSTAATSAQVLASVDGGRSWRLAWRGPAASARATLTPAQLPRSARAKLRVVVDDGWTTASADSARFASEGAPPQLTIDAPMQRTTTIEQGESLGLEATAFDDAGRALTGARVRWLDGSRVIATGTSAVAAGLRPGTHQITAIARDRAGRATQQRVRVRVRAAAPMFTALAVPPSVGASAGRVTIRVAASRPSELRVLGQRFSVGVRPRSISVRLRGRGPITLTLELRAEGRSSRVEAQVQR